MQDLFQEKVGKSAATLAGTGVTVHDMAPADDVQVIRHRTDLAKLDPGTRDDFILDVCKPSLISCVGYKAIEPRNTQRDQPLDLVSWQ